jgi:hypothetical protein
MPLHQQVLRIAALHDILEHQASMKEKVYFEFEAEIYGKQTQSKWTRKPKTLNCEPRFL